MTSKMVSDCKNTPKLVLASILRTLVVEHPTINCPILEKDRIAITTVAYNDTSVQPQNQAMGAVAGDPGAMRAT